MIPLMGFCYMMQYMDKLALSEAALFGLRQDLVREMPIRPTAADDAEPPRIRIQLDVCNLLLWLSRMELAKLVPDRAPTAREIRQRKHLPLGWILDVPCCRA